MKHALDQTDLQNYKDWDYFMHVSVWARTHTHMYTHVHLHSLKTYTLLYSP
jgi:hypothetical protein